MVICYISNRKLIGNFKLLNTGEEEGKNKIKLLYKTLGKSYPLKEKSTDANPEVTQMLTLLKKTLKQLL